MAVSSVLLLVAVLAAEPVPPARPESRLSAIDLDQVALRDTAGVVLDRKAWDRSRLLVVTFLGVECPLAADSAETLAGLDREFGPRGIGFLGVDSNENDTPEEIAAFARSHALPFPMLRDLGGRLAELLGASRTPQAVLLDERRAVRYRGRLDDRSARGAHRTIPTRRDLAVAIEDLLAGRPVERPETTVTGCPIDRPRPGRDGGGVTYNRDISRILGAHCVSCHRPGRVAPFSLTSYRQAARWGEAIVEAVEDRRMPPWHASPEHGRFANAPRLTDRERRALADWVESGRPEGDPKDLPPSPPDRQEGWGISRPDLVIPIPRPFAVPPEGVVDYQEFRVDPGFLEDRWVRAAEIRPGNRKVVHHVTVYLSPPGTDVFVAQGELGSYCLVATTPGCPPMTLPDGMAKRIPAGWRVVFVVHYTPVGTPQEDQTELGLVFADPETVRKEVATNLIEDLALAIPPRVEDHRVVRTQTLSTDVLLLAMFPHMHLRGRSFRYEAIFPDGTSEILLDVPRYDFRWQNSYTLAEPRRLPAGTTLRCTALYDNSAGNPNNPDPNVTVRYGRQSQDEMFNGYFDFAQADQDLTRPDARGIARQRSSRRGLMISSTLAMALLVVRVRKSRGRGVNPDGPSPAGGRDV